MNPMESAGCFAIVKAIQKNANTQLERVEFTVSIIKSIINFKTSSFLFAIKQNDKISD
jgi:hypothetical protein